jgi:hypothetical protein
MGVGGILSAGNAGCRKCLDCLVVLSMASAAAAALSSAVAAGHIGYLQHVLVLGVNLQQSTQKLAGSLIHSITRTSTMLLVAVLAGGPA